MTDEAPEVDATKGDRIASIDGGAPRPAWISTTYFAQGVPYSMVHHVVPMLFNALHASLPVQGLTSLYGLAWNAKFAWSPLVDRYSTTRRWLVVTEVILAILIASLALPADRGDLSTIARVLVIVAVVAATQDIAIDGFYLYALSSKEQAGYSGLRVAAYRVAILACRGGLVWLAGKLAWRHAFLAAGAALLVLALGHHLFLPREGPRPPRARVDSGYADAFVSFLKQPKIAVSLAFIAVYRAGDALMLAMSPAFFTKLGFDTADQGIYAGLLGALASIVGSMAGGAIVARYGLEKTLFPFSLIQNLALPIYAAVAFLTPSRAWVVAAILVEQLAAGIGTAVFAVFLMRRCSPAHKAAHFAIASALMSLATTGVGTSSGFLAEKVGFTVFFSIAFAASLPGLVLSRLVPKT